MAGSLAKLCNLVFNDLNTTGKGKSGGKTPNFVNTCETGSSENKLQGERFEKLLEKKFEGKEIAEIGVNFGENFEKDLVFALKHLDPEQREIILANIGKKIPKDEVLQHLMGGKGLEIVENNEKGAQIGKNGEIIDLNRQQEGANGEKNVINLQSTGLNSKEKFEMIAEGVKNHDKGVINADNFEKTSQNSEKMTGQGKNVAEIFNKIAGLNENKSQNNLEISDKNAHFLTKNEQNLTEIDKKLHINERNFEPENKSSEVGNAISQLKKTGHLDSRAEGFSFERGGNERQFGDGFLKQANAVFSVDEGGSKARSAGEQFASPPADAPIGRGVVLSKIYNSGVVDNPGNNIVGQVNHNIRTNFVGTDRDMTISLSPPELGKITIRFNDTNREITGRVEVENVEVKSEIEKSLPEILRTLQNAGVNLRRVEVVLSSKNDTMQQEDGAAGQWQMNEGKGQNFSESSGGFSQDDDQEGDGEAVLDGQFENENMNAEDDSLNIYI